jgi:hypothetical protein
MSEVGTKRGPVNITLGRGREVSTRLRLKSFETEMSESEIVTNVNDASIIREHLARNITGEASQAITASII